MKMTIQKDTTILASTTLLLDYVIRNGWFSHNESMYLSLYSFTEGEQGYIILAFDIIDTSRLLIYLYVVKAFCAPLESDIQH
jgi:hypothetical protein